MFGALAKIFFRTMKHILSLRISYVVAKHAMDLVTMMRRRLVVGLFVVFKDSISCLIIYQDLTGSIAVRIIGLCSRSNHIGLGCFLFPNIFDLDFGH